MFTTARSGAPPPARVTTSLLLMSDTASVLGARCGACACITSAMRSNTSLSLALRAQMEMETLRGGLRVAVSVGRLPALHAAMLATPGSAAVTAADVIARRRLKIRHPFIAQPPVTLHTATGTIFCKSHPRPRPAAIISPPGTRINTHPRGAALCARPPPQNCRLRFWLRYSTLLQV